MSNARRRAVTVPGRHVGRSKRLQGDRWGVPLSATHESSVGTRECKEKHKFKGNYIHRCFSLACQEDSVIIMSVEYFGRIWACQIPLLQIREIMDRNHRRPPPPILTERCLPLHSTAGLVLPPLRTSRPGGIRPTRLLRTLLTSRFYRTPSGGALFFSISALRERPQDLRHWNEFGQDARLHSR